MKVLIRELNSFRELQAKIESKLDNLEANIFTGKSKNGIEKVNDKSDFVISLLKSRITSLEISLSKKDGITEFLPIQLILHSESKFETSSNSDTESKSNKKIITTTITRVLLSTIQLRRNMAKVHYKMWKSFL